MSPFLIVLADGLVAVLLAATILTSIRLSRRIATLKGDEAALRNTIGDLKMATENAERAIGGLRATLDECDRALSERLSAASRVSADLSGKVEAGQGVVNRIARIVESAGQAPAPKEDSVPRDIQSANGERLSAAARAAQALSERAAQRLRGVAA